MCLGFSLVCFFGGWSALSGLPRPIGVSSSRPKTVTKPLMFWSYFPSRVHHRKAHGRESSHQKKEPRTHFSSMSESPSLEPFDVPGIVITDVATICKQQSILPCKFKRQRKSNGPSTTKATLDLSQSKHQKANKLQKFLDVS